MLFCERLHLDMLCQFSDLFPYIPFLLSQDIGQVRQAQGRNTNDQVALRYPIEKFGGRFSKRLPLGKEIDQNIGIDKNVLHLYFSSNKSPSSFL